MSTISSGVEFNFQNFTKKIESKWQNYWDINSTFKAFQPGEKGSEKKKFYCLDMFPYPSGDGLHIGHPLGYTATDIVSRFKRMNGFNVLHPMGWDAFGLPAEQHAIKKGIHPAITTKKNIETFKRQLKSLGFSYDWSREISTIEPSYFRWTQFLFKKLYERGLAYQAEVAVNWCEALGTVLANDEVIDGKSERGGHPVVRVPMRQWILKITDYAEKLLNDLELVDWPESTKEHQRNWIGKSEGARVRFQIKSQSSGINPEKTIEVFTTRVDTLMGVSFLALAPENPRISFCTNREFKGAVEKYQQDTAAKNDLQRTDLNKNKSGVFTGSYAIHPVSGQEIPIWVADYVLMNYGTGAVMGVPAHDDRDREFAEKMNLPIVTVIDDEKKILINSGPFSGLPSQLAIAKILTELEKNNAGEKHITYRLRDWLFARQRYWGEPIPVIHILEGQEKGGIRLLEDSELPLELPAVEKYEPTGTGESPLAALTSWVETRDSKSGTKAKRETNTMPGSAGSSWYFLRYMDPLNDKAPWSLDSEKYWGPVDLYVGGSEHAVGHLLYARFWHKVFFDMGLVSHPEPFQKLVHQGMILGEDGEKMSKSRGNVINPDAIVSEYGADSLRLFEMFLGPLEKAKPWQTKNIEGVYRFLGKFWRLLTQDSEDLSTFVQQKPDSEWSSDLVKILHKTIDQVTSDIEGLRFNTAISALMILVNELQTHLNDKKFVPFEAMEKTTLMLAPFAPHIAEEAWNLLGHKESLSRGPWPLADKSKLVEETFNLTIQINGKVRDNIAITKTMSEDEIKKMAINLDSVKKWLDGKEPKKLVYVKGKLLSVVV
jgi:leucyl-tRNA synthetase